MRRVFLGATAAVAIAVLAGCPVYPDSGSYRVCNQQGCFDCPDTFYASDVCTIHQCGSSADCGDGWVCTEQGICGAGGGVIPPTYDAGGTCAVPSDCAPGWTCGYDRACHPGNCGGAVGCPTGFACYIADGVPKCLQTLTADAGGRDATLYSDAGVGATDTGSDTLSDATSASTEAGDGSATADAGGGPCNADVDCGGSGARCVDGLCTPQGRLCSDGTQCAAAGSSCVDGLCTPTCSQQTPCAAGYACDFSRGVCSVNPDPCLASADCQGAAVCVEGHCAAPCAGGDAGSCPAEQVCVHGGCIPDQHATFACYNDGQSGALANTCPAGTICLHGDCYSACDADGAACASGSACKQVTVAKGTFAVCAPPGNLGSACDPASGVACGPGALCVDGFCR